MINFKKLKEDLEELIVIYYDDQLGLCKKEIFELLDKYEKEEIDSYT